MSIALGYMGAAGTVIATSGLTAVETLNRIDPAALSKWDDLTLKVALIVLLALSLLAFVTLLRWVAMKLIPLLEKLVLAIDRLNNMTRRCAHNQGLVLETDDSDH